MSAYKKWYDKNKESARKYKREAMKRLRAANPEKYAEQSRKAKRKIREKIFDMYGHQCSVCGFRDKRALTLDHIKNNGALERKTIGERGVYYRALNPDNKSDYRILCMNCQFIERHKANMQNQHSQAWLRLAWRILTGETE